MRLRRLALLGALWLVPVVALAQGFNSFSGRNHPELDWQVAETPRFKIMYPRHLAGIEAQAAAIAEATYDTLSANLGVTFDYKIRIYLTDEDEIVNGFAVPFSRSFTNIWIHQNEVASGWAGHEKWLRKVLAHELAHIFHFRAVSSSLGMLANTFADPLPRAFTEGLAQYQTEYWDAYRGDRWLRTAVLDDRLSYNDGRSIWNGRLLYAVGNSQVRFLAEQYGDSTLTKLLAHRKPVLLGLAEVHDFYAAFEATVGKSYRQFYDDWRRHVNVYYNTLAGQLENADSLDATRVPVAGQYLYDVQYSPDTSKVAVLALTSLARPVRRLFVVDVATQTVEIAAEGGIKGPVAWHPDGTHLAFARAGRGRHGSILNDLWVVRADGRKERQLTHSRRALAPTFSPDGQRLAFIGTEGGTANLFTLDLATGEETQHTQFTGDIQIADVQWHPRSDSLLFSRFNGDGRRPLMLLDLRRSALRLLTDGTEDDRQVVWRPDGTQFAYTSLRDDVPNVFVYDFATDTHRRVTNLATGATGHDWLPPDSAHAAGQLVVIVAENKSRDRALRFDAGRTAPDVTPTVPRPYAAWTTHQPPHFLDSLIPPNPDLIERRYAYSSWKNLTHVLSFGLPYYSSPDDWGATGVTIWMEPLGKHLFGLSAAVSGGDFAGKSYFVGSYVNNQWHPTIYFNGYYNLGTPRLYSDDLLVENLAGGDVTFDWPLDWAPRPYTGTRFGLRLRYVEVSPIDEADFFEPGRFVPIPEPGQLADLRLSLIRKKQRPYRYNAIHPLDGVGVRLMATGAAKVLGADRAYLRGDLSAYAVVPFFGLNSLYFYGRAQAQTGGALTQDFVGLDRADVVQLALPGFVPLALGDTERVRGYRTYALGNRLLFGTIEYRALLLRSLQTNLLGLVRLGATSLALFADGGLVWTDAGFDDATRRLGLGAELKNLMTVMGAFEVGHSLGIAQPAEHIGTDNHYEVYYRIRAAVAF